MSCEESDATYFTCHALSKVVANYLDALRIFLSSYICLSASCIRAAALLRPPREQASPSEMPTGYCCPELLDIRMCAV